MSKYTKKTSLLSTLALSVMVTLLLVGASLYASARSFTIRGQVKDLIAARNATGIGNVLITASVLNEEGQITDTLSTHTDEEGKYSFTFDSGDARFASFKKFAINTPAVPDGYWAIYAANNNVANFWETGYLSQVAGLNCRAERAFCWGDEVWRDKSSSSGYDFVVEPAKPCNTTTGPIMFITNDDGKATSAPSVASDGSTIMLATRGGDGSIWITTARNLVEPKWADWVNISGITVKEHTFPVIRAINRGRFVVFIQAADDRYYGLLRDAKGSLTPFVDVNGTFNYDFRNFRDLVKVGDTVYRFSRIEGPTNGVTFQQCN